MSPRNVSARFIADEETVGDVRVVEVFGHVLTEKFAKIEVEDDVLAKLQANPHIEVRGADAFDHDGDGKPGGSRPRKGKEEAPAEPVEPEASDEA